MVVRIWIGWVALLGLFAGHAHADAPTALDAEVQAEIEYLLDRVADSGHAFIRNGDEHDSEDAAQHMRRKYEHFADRGKIVSVEDFIDMAGTRSLLTGREYRVRLSDGTEMPTAQWLRAETAVGRLSVAGVTE